MIDDVELFARADDMRDRLSVQIGLALIPYILAIFVARRATSASPRVNCVGQKSAIEIRFCAMPGSMLATGQSLIIGDFDFFWSSASFPSGRWPREPQTHRRSGSQNHEAKSA